MKKILETFGEEETRALGRALGKTAVPGEVICLDGDLGVGKTVLAQGFAEGLGIAGPVASPTFTIVQTYETGRLPFFHMDVYRLEDEDELEAIGGSEMLEGDGVCLVEWGSRTAGLFPPGTLYVLIEKDLAKGTDYRRITVTDKEEPDEDHRN